MSKLYALKGEQTEIKGVPDVIPILPLGHVHSQKGEFDVDEESFHSMKAHMEKRGIDIVVDYEHQTLENVQAPAGGWIKDIYLQDGAIAAKVEWTPTARKYLENKEYRYLSPVILVRKTDGKATVLHSVALTNTPAIDGMFPIINSVDLDQYDDEGGKTMDLKVLAKMLGLPEDATEEQILEKIKGTVGEVEQLKEDAKKKEEDPKNEGDGEVVANKTILGLLNLKEDAKTEDVASAILALKAAPKGTVSESEFKALKEKIANDDADKAVMLALKSGKISTAQKAWAKEYALKDPQGFEKFVEKAPQVVPIGEIEFETKVNKDTTLDETSMLVCKMMGISKEDIEKYGKDVL
ncbi:phage protease [Bacteroidales bacterium MSK.15.36]|nr:phage protease [Bacteroidales bacterium MSK.15.36]